MNLFRKYSFSGSKADEERVPEVRGGRRTAGGEPRPPQGDPALQDSTGNPQEDLSRHAPYRSSRAQQRKTADHGYCSLTIKYL